MKKEEKWQVQEIGLTIKMTHNREKDLTHVDMEWEGHHLSFPIPGSWTRQQITAAVKKLAEEDFLHQAHAFLREALEGGEKISPS